MSESENIPDGVSADTKVSEAEIGAPVLESEEQSSSVKCMKSQDSVSTTNEQNTSETISKLEREVLERTKERDAYKTKLEEAEKKLLALQESYGSSIKANSNIAVDQCNEMQELQKKLNEATSLLEDRGRVLVNQENQINALNNQVVTLKEVVACTRDLLQIRNTEVNHLQTEVDDMEKRISEERERHKTMMSKMDMAVRLNADLKKEYETQLRLFKDLRERYDEKVNLLSDGKESLESPTEVK